MKIVSANYVKSFRRVQDLDLQPLPSVAFIGRSNVGKSSLINSLLNRKKLVKTSATPGKTQLINYFIINQCFYFIDLPGYGFAKVPKEVKTTWQKMISDFLMRCPELRAIVQLLDCRHKPSGEDYAFQKMVKQSNKPCLIIANKADKLKKNRLSQSLRLIRQEMALHQLPLVHSMPEKRGIEEIWQKLAGYLNIDQGIDSGSM